MSVRPRGTSLVRCSLSLKNSLQDLKASGLAKSDLNVTLTIVVLVTALGFKVKAIEVDVRPELLVRSLPSSALRRGATGGVSWLARG